MAQSSILGGERAPAQPKGTDVDALGPSDSSDSGSDVQTDLNHAAVDEGDEGAYPISHDGTSDAAGTGERGSADAAAPVDDADLMPDRIGVFPRDAMEVATSIEDMDAASVDELADSDADDGGEEGVDDDENGTPDRP
ncbi:MAG: hypothetical protein V4636_11305 [Pseudomonadota bacterium]